MRSRLSSPALRVALACAAAACVAVPSLAASAKPKRAEAGVPAVADFRLSAPRVRAGEAPALRFSWRVRDPRGPGSIKSARDFEILPRRPRLPL